MDKQGQTSAQAFGNRPNVAMAEIVDTAIGLLDQYGKDHATEYLIGHGIGFRIIDRVLADPQFRRQKRQA